MTVIRHGFVGALSPEYRQRLMSLAREVVWPADTRVFDEGDEADRFWIIRSGRVALDVHLPGAGAITVETIGNDELLGWSWLFEPYRWHLGAQALTPTRAYEFDAARVRTARDADPAFGLAITDRVAQVIARRLKATRLRLLDLYAPPGAEHRDQP